MSGRWLRSAALAFAGGVPSIAAASDFGRVAAVGLATLGAIACSVATVIVLGVALSRDPRKSQGLARGIGTLGMIAGLFGAAFGASEFDHQDWTFAAFVFGSLVACIAAFLWFESRCERAAKQSPGAPPVE